MGTVMVFAVLVASGGILSGTAVAARCALEGKLCTPSGASGNNPECCGPDVTGGVVLTCPPTGSQKNHCTRVSTPPATTPTTSTATTTSPGSGCVELGKLCDPDGTPRQCCDDAPHCWGRPADHNTCHREPSPTAPTTTPTTAPPTTTLPTTLPPAPSTDDLVRAFEQGRPMVLPDYRMLTFDESLVPRQKRGLFVLEHGAWRTATQPERRAGVFRLYVIRELAMQFDRYSKSCNRALNRGEYRDENTRHRVHYWTFDRNAGTPVKSIAQFDFYDHANHVAKKLRDCALRNETTRRECAASPYMTDELLDWLNWRIVDGACVAGGRFTLPALPETEDLTLAMVGEWKVTDKIDRTNPVFVDIITRLVAAHHATDEAFCRGTQGPPRGAVPAIAAECLTRPGLNPDHRWACQMVFPTYKDTGELGWKKQQLCDLDLGCKGTAMHLWGDAELGRYTCRGDEDYYGCEGTPAGTVVQLSDRDALMLADRIEQSHFTCHVIGANRENRSTLRIGDHEPGSITGLPQRTPDEWYSCILTGTETGFWRGLLQSVGLVGSCRPKWIPDPATWRLLVPAGAM